MESKRGDEEHADGRMSEDTIDLLSSYSTAPPCPALDGLEFDLMPRPVKCQLLHP